MPDKSLDELLEEADELPEGPARASLLDEAVRQADALLDTQAGFHTRLRFIREALNCAWIDRAMVAFAWCLAHVDADPEKFDEEDLFHEYKWIVNRLTGLPQVPRAEVLRLLDDYERRLVRAGHTPRTILHLRWNYFGRMGEFEEAFGPFERWRDARRDSVTDCAECEASDEMQFLIRLGRDAQAFELVEPLLRRGIECRAAQKEIPAYLLRALIRLERWDEARDCAQRGGRYLARSPHFTEGFAENLQYLTRAGELPRALRLFEKGVPVAAQTSDLEARFYFFAATAPLFAAVAAKRRRKIQVSLPAGLACHREDGSYEPAELAAWFDGAARDLADRFNRRNGNEYFTRLLTEARALALGE